MYARATSKPLIEGFGEAGCPLGVPPNVPFLARVRAALPIEPAPRRDTARHSHLPSQQRQIHRALRLRRLWLRLGRPQLDAGAWLVRAEVDARASFDHIARA